MINQSIINPAPPKSINSDNIIHQSSDNAFQVNQFDCDVKIYVIKQHLKVSDLSDMSMNPDMS